MPVKGARARDRDLEGMSREYVRQLAPAYPARRTVPAKLVQGPKVEIEMIATQ